MDFAGDLSNASDDSPGGEPVPPDLVIAPAHPACESTEIVFEVRPATDGSGDALPVFSSVRQLVETFGPAQPWVALPLIKARELAAAGGIPQVVLDPVVPPGAWRWHYSDLEALARSLD
jgi:hypothetical protein